MAAGRGSAPDGLPPPAKVVEVVESYYGTSVRDPYRWMEQEGEDLGEMVLAHDAHAMKMLGGIEGQAELRAELERASGMDATLTAIAGWRGTIAMPRLFLLKRSKGEEVPQLYLRDGWSGADQLLVDPRVRDGGGRYHTVSSVVASPDGKHVAYRISMTPEPDFSFPTQGSDEAVVEILQLESRQVLKETFVPSGPPTINWRDDRSFFYQRALPSMMGQGNSAVYLHTLGDDPAKAQPVLSQATKELELEAGPVLEIQTWRGSRWALASVKRGEAQELDYFVALADAIGASQPGSTAGTGNGVTKRGAGQAKPKGAGQATWRRVSRASDRVTSMVAHGDTLYALSTAGAPNGRVLAIDAARGTALDSEVYVAEHASPLDELAAAQDAMYLQYFDGSKVRIERMTYDRKRREEIALPFGANASIYAVPNRPGVLIWVTDWTHSLHELFYEPEPVAGPRLRPLGLQRPSRFDASAITSEVVQVKSADGTMVPMSIVRRADHPRDGSAPALLHSYQAYGGIDRPSFQPVYLVWVKRGGVRAHCHGRGTGNYGARWHQAGIKGNRERAVEDFVACAEYLIGKKYTSAARLTAESDGAGALAVGGAITRRPELFTAAVLGDALVNLVRFETTAAGLHNVEELGTAAEPASFADLLASDPYHRLASGAKLPALLLQTNLYMSQVPVWMTAKFVARARASSGDARPVLLRVGGVDAALTEQQQAMADWAEVYSFALWQSGLAARK